MITARYSGTQLNTLVERVSQEYRDPIEEDYALNRGDEHTDGETGDEHEQQSGQQFHLAPLSQQQRQHSHSNNEVMQSSSMNAQSNRRGSTTVGGGLNSPTANNLLVAHPFANGSNSNNELVLSRRPSAVLSEILSTRRPSALMAALTRQHYRPQQQNQHRQNMMEIREGQVLGASNRTINMSPFHNGPECPEAMDYKRRNRRIGDDALSTALSALYCKVLVIMGIAMPVTEILSKQVPVKIYQGFYFFLYLGSIFFVCFVYAVHMRTRAVFSIIKSYHEKTSNTQIKKRASHFGSFYLRVGAIAFAIGTMVYSGLEFGLYFEMKGQPECSNYFSAMTPIARMLLCIIQMQFIFLNTTELDLARHKVVARFGLMHLVGTNLCEWLHVLVEETKHEIFHLSHHDEEKTHHAPLSNHTNPLVGMVINTTTTLLDTVTTTMATDPSDSRIIAKRSLDECHRTSIMGSLVQNASPFLFPCTIEYSLICAVILYEMWKKVKTIPDIEKSRRSSLKPNHHTKSAHHFSVDCSGAHRGMFGGILVIVMTIICLIMYFVLHKADGYLETAITEVTIFEILLYVVMIIAVLSAMFKMRDLRFQRKNADHHHASTVQLDNTLLVLAQSGVYVYAMFSIMAFAIHDSEGARDGLAAEILSLIQTSLQTLFVLNASWRRCKGAKQNRQKPGRQIVTFLLVANMSMWFINTMIKGHAAFRPSHLDFFGLWAWTVITHVSMPLAIFYRFHSTICLFEIWKSAYKNKDPHH